MAFRSSRLSHSNTRNRLIPVFIAALIVVLVAAIGIYYHKTENQPVVPTAQAPITYSTDSPEATVPDPASWKGLPADPKYITLPSIGAQGFLQNVGVDQDGLIAVPNNVNKAGWFVDSVLPGKKGLSVIDGHIVTEKNYAGIFQNLSKLKADDIFSIEFGDGSFKKFSVVSMSLIDVSKVADKLFSQDPTIPSQLNLVTCGGTYDEQLKGFAQRVVVVSRYVPS